MTKSGTTSGTQEHSDWGWIIPIIIISITLLAHSSVLFNDYLRQDDWNGMLWNRSNLSSRGDVYAWNVEMLRPISTPIILFSDFINYHMDRAWIIRLINILLLGASAILTYRWQRKLGLDSIFSICFALCSVLIPPAQIISSTGGYTVMIMTVIWSQLACICMYRGFSEAKHSRWWYALGILSLYLALLAYTLAATYIFIFLFIYYMKNMDEKWWHSDSFIFRSTAITLACMASILIVGKLIYFIFHIVPRDPQRAIAINWDIPNKFKHLWVMLQNSLHFINYNISSYGMEEPTSKLFGGVFFFGTSLSIIPFILWCIVFILALFCHGRLSASSASAGMTLAFVLRNILIFLGVLILAYAPALPPHYEGGYALRYMLVTMPLVLYSIFWSLRQIAAYAESRHILQYSSPLPGRIFCIITLLGALLCAHNVSRYLAGPADHELNFVRSAIEHDALPELNQGKPVTLYLIASGDGAGTSILPHHDQDLEYGFGITNYTAGWLFAAAVYTMREFGYESIETTPTWSVIEWSDDKIRMKLKWGYIYATRRTIPHMQVPEGTKEVLIDMGKMDTYW